jgi:hypothetical protein
MVGKGKVTVVGSREVLFVVPVSLTVVTLALLVGVPAAAAATFTIKLNALVPLLGAIAAELVQVTVAAATHDQAPVLELLLNVIPAGSVSVTVVVPVVAAPPVLVTVIVYVPVWPTTKLLTWDFAIVTSMAIPVPLRLTLWGLKPSGESAIESVPLRLPAAVGLKMTLTVQLEPAVTTAPLVQVLVPSWKSPVTVGVLEIVIDAEVPFVSVTGWGELEELINWAAANVRGLGLTLTTELLPVPDSRTVGEPPVVWMVAVSALAPSTGVNLMYTAHEPVNAESGLLALQAFSVWVASML